MRNIPLLLLPLLLSMAACGNKEQPKNTSMPAATNEIPVRVTAVQSINISLPIHASGILTSSAEQRLSFKTGGIVRKVYVDEGDVVRAGQLLAILDKTEIEAHMNQAEQALNKAERDLARADGLYRDSSATLEQVQNATTARDVAKETVRMAQFNLQFSEVRATRSGTIVKKLTNEGEMIGPGMPAFVLYETGPNDWVVKTDVSDRDWARLAKGLPVAVHFDAYPDTRFNGTIGDLPATADPSNGLYPIEVKVNPQGKKFAPGLFAQVDISPKQVRPYTVVPIEAIVEGNGKSAFVFSLGNDGRSVQKIPILVAFFEGNQAIVASGLENVTKVVTSGTPYLNERSVVKTID